MTFTIRLHTRWAYMLLWLAAAVGCIFCAWFLLSSHDHLSAWYLRLNDCFYKKAEWTSKFFTPAVKHEANNFCWLALAIITAGVLFFSRHLRKRASRYFTISVFITWQGLLAAASLAVAASVLWRYGKWQAWPAYDEVFSAVNCAGIHPFQSVSYYMLPNNHLLFNLINNVLFHFYADKVASGRLLSLLAYMGVLLLAYTWFRGIVKQRWVAFLCAVAIGLQFQVWGFGFQARGYELYLLAEWAMFVSMFRYLSSKNDRWLYVFAISCVIGYFTIPSFLYFHAACLLFLALYQLIFRKWDGAVWKCQIVALGLVFLAYLPALCFSGMDALTNNMYVSPMTTRFTTTNSFLTWIYPQVSQYIDHCFADVVRPGHPINIVLFLCPILLLFSGKKQVFLAGLFYVVLWLVFFIIVLLMVKFPFERNLIGHQSIAIATILCMAYLGISYIAERLNAPIIAQIAFPILLILISLHFFRTNKRYIADTLYDYNVNTICNETLDALKVIPPQATVFCSDESFYFYFWRRKAGMTADKRLFAGQQYVIRINYEPFPDGQQQNYLLIKEVQWYQLFRRR